MQKNIVLGVNDAMAQEQTKNDKPVNTAHRSEEFLALRDDIASLKQENSLFAAAVEEMRLQNEELKNKIDKLISSSSVRKKKKKTNNKQETGK